MAMPLRGAGPQRPHLIEFHSKLSPLFTVGLCATVAKVLIRARPPAQRPPICHQRPDELAERAIPRRRAKPDFRDQVRGAAIPGTPDGPPGIATIRRVWSCFVYSCGAANRDFAHRT